MAAAVIVAAFGLAPAVSSAGQTAGESALTLEAAVARALTANQELVAARLARAVSTAGVGVAGERLNPDVSYEAARETPRQAIGVTVPIELGGKRGRRVDVAVAAVATTDAEIDRLAADVRNRVRRAYFELAAAERRVTLASDGRALAVRANETAATRAAAGDIPRQDVLQTQLGVFEADQALSFARGEVGAARALLNVLLGAPADSSIALAEDLTPPDLPLEADVLARAAEANADLVALDRRIAEQVARRELARSLQTPDLLAGAAVTYHAEPEFRAGWRASADVTVPLFTRHKAAVTLEDAELTRLRAERAATADLMAGDVRATLARAGAARERIVRFDTEILPTVVQVEEMAQEGYSAGQTPLVAVQAALRQTREVRQQALEAGLEYQIALADLERAMGTRLR